MTGAKLKSVVGITIPPGVSQCTAAHRELRDKLDAAAVRALRAGLDWTEGPVTGGLVDPFSTRSLFEPWRSQVTVQAGPIAPGTAPPEGWRVLRCSDWIAAGRPGDRP